MPSLSQLHCERRQLDNGTVVYDQTRDNDALLIRGKTKTKELPATQSSDLETGVFRRILCIAGLESCWLMALSDDETETSVGGNVADDEVEEIDVMEETLRDVAGDRTSRRVRVDPIVVPVDATESAEIVALSGRIRRAIECPVCLLLPGDLACLCPNGHAVCGNCLTQVWNRDAMHHCPLCRAPLAPTQDAQVTASKLEEVVCNVMVSCAHRSLGCPELHAVYDVTGHEAQCSHAPDVRCLVSVCQWIGVYHQLFDHVLHAHNDVALEAEVIYHTTYNRRALGGSRSYPVLCGIDKIEKVTMDKKKKNYAKYNPESLWAGYIN